MKEIVPVDKGNITCDKTILAFSYVFLFEPANVAGCNRLYVHQPPKTLPKYQMILLLTTLAIQLLKLEFFTVMRAKSTISERPQDTACWKARITAYARYCVKQRKRGTVTLCLKRL